MITSSYKVGLSLKLDSYWLNTYNIHIIILSGDRLCWIHIMYAISHPLNIPPNASLESILMKTFRKPSAELYSVIPKGDKNKPRK